MSKKRGRSDSCGEGPNELHVRKKQKVEGTKITLEQQINNNFIESDQVKEEEPEERLENEKDSEINHSKTKKIENNEETNVNIEPLSSGIFSICEFEFFDTI